MPESQSLAPLAENTHSLPVFHKFSLWVIKSLSRLSCHSDATNTNVAFPKPLRAESSFSLFMLFFYFHFMFLENIHTILAEKPCVTIIQLL